MNHTVGAASGRKPRSRMLPALMVVFAICWGLVVTLAVLQDRMIDAQRDLIQLLSKAQHRPSTVAEKTRVTRAPEKESAKSKGHAGAHSSDSASPSSQVPFDQVQPSAQVPLSQHASSEAPSSQAKPQASTKSGRNLRKAKPTPAQPPLELTDPSDMRRVLFSI